MGLCCLLASGYVVLCGSYFLAAFYAQKLDLPGLQRAVRFDPHNAEYRYLLGRYQMLAAQEPEAAVRSFQSALSLNPYDSRYWLDLANAFHVLGNLQGQRFALEKAVQVDPRTPQTAWQVANFYWARGENDKALAELSVVLQNDPELTAAALQQAWRIRPDVDSLLRNVIPANADVYSSFLSLMISRQDAAAQTKIWDCMVRLGQPVEKRFVFDYVRSLIDQRQPAQASLAWRQAAPLAGLEAYQPSPKNLVVNGDFNLLMLNGGFDWLYEKSAEVKLSLDPTEAHMSQQSLLLDFDSRGLEDAGIRQMIPVKENSRYRFSSYFKTDDLRGAGGPRFVLQDAFTGATYLQSDAMMGTPFWKPLTAEVTTGSDTTLLVLRIQRFPAGAAIRGKLWIDGVSLTPETGAAQ